MVSRGVMRRCMSRLFFFFQAEDGIRDGRVTGVQTCALPISRRAARWPRLRRHLYAAITNNAPRASLPPDCPLHLQAIIHRLLAFQPAHRYQTAADIRADLQRYADHETPVAAQYYDTPATLPVMRAAGVGVVGTEPVPITELPLPVAVASTDPVPAGPDLQSSAVALHIDGPGALPRRSYRAAARRLVNAIAMAAVIGVVASEGVAWLFAERFRDTIAAIDERS